MLLTALAIGPLLVEAAEAPEPAVAALADRFEAARESLRGDRSPEAMAAAVAVLTEALGDPVLEQEAVDALAELGPAAVAAVPRLAGMVRELGGQAEAGMEIEDPRWTPAWALARIGAPAVPALVELLRHDGRMVRWLATWALGEMGGSAGSALPSLIEALDDPVPWLRADAARVIGRLAPASNAAVQALTRALDDADQDVRAEAALALGSHGRLAEAALPVLSALEDSAVRPAAVEAAEAIERDLAEWRLRPAADNLPALISAAVKARGDTELLPVADALTQLGAQAVPEILATLPDLRGELAPRVNLLIVLRNLGPAANEAVPALTATLADPEPILRRLACEALAAVGAGAAQALARIKGLARDPDRSVRQAAEAALAEIRGRS